MKNHFESQAIRRVMVGTDRSEPADRAVHWAAGFAHRYGAELFVVQVVVPQYPVRHRIRRSRTNTRCGRQQ